MLRPTTPSVASSLAIDQPILEEGGEEHMDHENSSSFDNSDANAPPLLESVVHLHELPAQFAYAYFERDNQTESVECPSGTIVRNGFPVRPRVVHADLIVWKPVVSNDGLAGHRFDLLDTLGELQAHIEVFVSPTAIVRVALVHSMYTQVARASGLIDHHSLLEFNSPTVHYQKLVRCLQTLRNGKIYLPVNELATGSQLDAPLRINQAHANNPSAAVATTVWRHVVAELRAISGVAIEAARQHNASEFARVGLS